MAAKENEKEVGVDRRLSAGSALILAVVLVSLLAMVGVLFVLAARVDSIGTSAVSDSSDLGRAVDTVIVRISNELALDVPGVLDANLPSEEYYDYPAWVNPADGIPVGDRWLASLEPEEPAVAPYWPHITDLYNKWGLEAENVPAVRLPAYQAPADVNDGLPADADGDGVSDSKWVLVEGMSSSKGRPIFTAVRVVDNGAMLNLNTIYEFDPTKTDANLIDGSALTQINLMNIYKRADDPCNIHRFRCDGLAPDLLTYNYEYAIQPQNPFRGAANYLPFDISDELDLRNRFLLDMWHNSARIEAAVSQTLPYYNGNLDRHRYTPIDTSDDFSDWQEMVNGAFAGGAYDFRHILTTYNMDRIIAPDGSPMMNVNRIYDLDDVDYLFRTLFLKGGLHNVTAAQVAVNMKDYVDEDSEVTAYAGGGAPYYGFESPCVYISELGLRYTPDVNDSNVFDKSYAVELYKPYAADDNPVGWTLKIDGGAEKPINWPATGQLQVTYWNNPQASFIDSNTVSTCNPNCDPNDPNDPNCDPNCDPNSSSTVISITRDTFVFDACSVITLLRPVSDGGTVVVDRAVVPGWFQAAGGAGELSFQRDIGLHRCIKRLWDTTGSRSDSLTLDAVNDYNRPGELPIQAHPADSPLRNIGELGMLFRRPAYYVLGSEAPEDLLVVPIGYGADANNTEEAVRLDLSDPNYQPILNYLTVFDPRMDGVDNDGDGVGFDKNGNGIPDANEIDWDELKIAGRININTAPWFVIAQLPWMRDMTRDMARDTAQAIVGYRDRLTVFPPAVNYSTGRARGMWNPTDPSPPIYVREEPGFASVAELVNVTHDLAGMGGGLYIDSYDIRRYGRDAEGDRLRFPDLTPPSQTEGDGAANDFEERDLIFARVSNLVTVRSDVFTAYILVRIGSDGPQKRVVAVLDRSDIYPNGAGGFNGRVKIRAVHPVPDPR